MTVTIEFLGHAAFLISAKTDAGTFAVAVDPFLDGNPVAKKAPGDIECTHVCLTHGHADHLGDAPTISSANNAPLYAAFEICEAIGDQCSSAEPMNPGGRVETDFGFVALTKAFHSSSYNGQYMGQPCGLILRFAAGGRDKKDVTIYHAGDTDIFGDMELIREIYAPDVAILPVGDRFTMGPETAARAAEMIRPKVAIPCHYGTWDLLVKDISAFKPKGVEVRELGVGETFEL